MSELLMSHLWQVFDHADGQEKTASLTQQFLRDRIRETSVLNRILPSELITASEVERNTNEDDPLIRIDIEPNSGAMAMGYTAHGEAKYFTGKRYECHFNKYSSQHFVGYKSKMMTSRMPVRQIVEGNFVLDIQEAMDHQFRRSLDTAAILSNQVVQVVGYEPAHLKAAIQRAQNMMLNGAESALGGSRGRRRATRMIMTESRWSDIAQLDVKDWGTFINTITVEGHRNIKTLLGLDVVTSINSRTGLGAQAADNVDAAPQDNDLSAFFRTRADNDPAGSEGSVWPENSIYLVTDPAFLGVNFMIDDTNQEFDRKDDKLEWWCWCINGHAIGNCRSVVRIDLV